MGVPAFYRWLTRKFPRIVRNVVEESLETSDGDGGAVPLDTSKPNPNGMEFDNLYLDMNGIIHPCSHPEDGAAPKNEDEMMLAIFAVVDRIFAMVRPRKLLYLAIDGVAPRAKMNQQRSRRFRSAQEREEIAANEEKLRAQWRAEGRAHLLPPKDNSKTWDSNVITPGTPFMARVAECLHYYIAERVNNDPGWADIEVILSDAKVPGEGEHKVMSFIRNQRSLPGYDPNTSHVLCGLDADLIMLALATHEPHFFILRETVLDQNKNKCFLCGQEGHIASQCTGKAPSKVDDDMALDPASQRSDVKPYQLVMISVLREYLAYELFVPNLPFKWDMERVIDDWVFMCFFVGNDFLPHLPSLSIYEGSIDLLAATYRQLLPSLGGYLTERGKLNFSRIDVLLSRISESEDAVFRRRKQRQEHRERRQRMQDRSREEQNRRRGKAQPKRNFIRNMNTEGTGPDKKPSALAMQEMVKAGEDPAKNASAAAELKRRLKGEEVKKRKRDEVEEQAEAVKEEDVKPPHKRVKSEEEDVDMEEAVKEEEEEEEVVKEEEEEDDDDDDDDLEEEEEEDEEAVEATIAAAKKTPLVPRKEEAEDAPKEDEVAPDFGFTLKKLNRESGMGEVVADPIRLGERGWKARYYWEKMRIRINSNEPEELAKLRALVKAYATGLAWVFAYYYRGCPSWGWYFPFHYAPMASDLKNLDRYEISFDTNDEPFMPFEQLMGVLPASSGHCLPPRLADLMSNPQSPIIDFYPTDFKLDLNGKRFKWQAVVLLPFIDEKRLLDTVRDPEVTATFSANEAHRNDIGHDYIFAGMTHALANTIMTMYTEMEGRLGKLLPEMTPEEIKASPPAEVKMEEASLAGQVHPYADAVTPDAKIDPKLPHHEPLVNPRVVSAIFTTPPDREHMSVLLPGVKEPERILNERDHEHVDVQNRKTARRNGFGGVMRSGGGGGRRDSGRHDDRRGGGRRDDRGGGRRDDRGGGRRDDRGGGRRDDRGGRRDDRRRDDRGRRDSRGRRDDRRHRDDRDYRGRGGHRGYDQRGYQQRGYHHHPQQHQQYYQQPQYPAYQAYPQAYPQQQMYAPPQMPMGVPPAGYPPAGYPPLQGGYPPQPPPMPAVPPPNNGAYPGAAAPMAYPSGAAAAAAAAASGLMPAPPPPGQQGTSSSSSSTSSSSSNPPARFSFKHM